MKTEMEKNFTTSRETILSLIQAVRREVEVKKKISESDEELAQQVMDMLKEEDKVFATEENRLCYWNSMTRKVLWLEANTEEANEIISRLRSGDEKFAEDFFYGTDPDKCNVSRFRSKILSKVRETYKLDISVMEFGNILYSFLWNKGAWSVFDKYSRKSGIFCWLATVSRHELMRSLKNRKMINFGREYAVGNTYNVELSEKQSKDIYYMWQEGKNNANPLSDVFGVGLDYEELHEKVLEFLYSFPQKLNWTEEERIVWTLRFIEDTSPVEVAELVGRKRSWVDTKYSRLNARFNKAVREWWFRNAV